MAHVDPALLESLIKSSFDTRFISIYACQSMRMSLALADRAQREQGPAQKHPRHHSKHPFPSDNLLSRTNNRNRESHLGNSTKPRQRPKPSTTLDTGKRVGPSINLQHPLHTADKGWQSVSKANKPLRQLKTVGKHQRLPNQATPVTKHKLCCKPTNAKPNGAFIQKQPQPISFPTH
jgi:hypothetical protein